MRIGKGGASGQHKSINFELVIAKYGEIPAAGQIKISLE